MEKNSNKECELTKHYIDTACNIAKMMEDVKQ